MEAKIKETNGKILSIPLSTYRVQFWRDFPIKKALDNNMPQYLKDLGIAYCYSSPLLQARSGSTHGYDVVDHLKLNPEISSADDFSRFSALLKSLEIGLLLDIVPNHVGIASPSSRWWMDVLEHGRGSIFSDHFDINWEAQNNKMLAPFLGSPIGQVLSDGQLKVVWNDKEELTEADGRGIGGLQLHYYSSHFPLDPSTILPLLPSSVPENIRKAFQAITQRNELIGAEHQLGRHARREASYEAKNALNVWMKSDEAAKAMSSHLDKINEKGSSIISDLVAAQPYRLCYWKLASDELNYRRFFDINELLAIKSENKGVFEESVQLVKEWIEKGQVQALRLDHPDGLYDPAKFFVDLQEIMTPARPKDLIPLDETRPLYVLVEKILEPGEDLRESWPVSGTVGYEYMNVLNDVYVNTNNEKQMREIYEKYVTDDYEASQSAKDFAQLLYTSKKMLLTTSFETELHSLGLLFKELANFSAIGRDFSLQQIKKALAEVVANCPVYRSYITQETGPIQEDEKVIDTTFRALREKNTVDSHLSDLLEQIYRCKGEDKSQEYKKKQRHAVMKLQQLTGPVMAKGLEDTSFYRYFLLTSLNEVGGDPDKFGLSKDDFHKYNQKRVKAWPHGMSNSSTHDTKRSEDVRARINTLSEIPSLWRDIVYKWRDMNSKFKSNVPGILGTVPGPNEEYMIYQTLVGVWPLGAKDASSDFIDRVKNYLTKCMKEAKLHTTWVKQNEPYEKAMISFLESIMKDETWKTSFLSFINPLCRAGKLNSVSLVALKLTCPGVPDIYQGQELWDFSLVDPDNRRPVDYEVRRKVLNEVQGAVKGNVDFSSFASKVLSDSDDSGTIKMLVTERLLNLRNRNPALFLTGDYTPITAPGHVVAYSRSNGSHQIVVASKRFFVESSKNNEEGAIEITGTYKDVLTGSTYSFSGSASLSKLFSVLPFVVLERQ